MRGGTVSWTNANSVSEAVSRSVTAALSYASRGSRSRLLLASIHARKAYAPGGRCPSVKRPAVSVRAT